MVAKRVIACLAAFICFNSLVSGDEVDQVRALSAEHLKANRVWQHEIAAAATSAEHKALEAKNPDIEFAPRFLQLAEGMNANSDAAAEALVYTICADRNGPIGDKAADLLARDHVNSWPLELLFNSKPLPDDAAAQNLFRSIAERSKKRAYRGQTIKILADFLKDSNPNEAEKLYESVLQDYANVKSFEDPRYRLGEQAQHALFYLNHLIIGKIAPAFEGKDANGKTIKLSDYRSQVVLVYFCSISCVPCHKLYPYWRSLVERTKGKPFVLIGINSDPPQTAPRIIKDENITWPTIWEDYRNPTSINVQWYVSGWPTIFLIDQQGIIRQHWFGSPGTEVMDQQIQELLKQ